MALVPTPCSCGGGGGGTVETCCSPSITAQPLCCDDGRTILVVLRSPCADCGGTAFPPETAGWVDPTTGVFTPGPAPAGCGSCSTACADTVCVQRCDDTNGDGLADTTYSELWCVRDDGTTALLLTYQDDPSTPYTPVAPVDCELGSMTCHTQLLCDDSGAFLRRFTFISDGTAAFVDVALDGETPHVVIGTVRDCAQTSDCDQPREPAATVGLCLADGTPIAVVVTRDCQGVTREEGWINLTTGAYSTGQPPAGVMACGESRSVSTTGTFCDVDANGNVVGLVLIEYTYAADGSVSSVRLVDATTGQTYTAQGTITTCPAGVDQPEQDLVVLCDIAADGSVTRFVRDYRRDENGQIVGHTDYTLAGANYQPTGTVDVCEGEPTQPCRNTSTLLVCDVPTDGAPTPTVTDTNPTPYYPYPTGSPVAGAQALWDGGTLNLPAGTSPQPGTVGRVNSIAATIQAPRPACDTGTAHVTVSVNVLQQGPDNGCAQTGHLRLFNGTTQAALTLLPVNTPAGWFGTLTVEADIPAADLAAGNVAVALALDAYDDNPVACSPSPRRTGWQLSAFTATTAYDQTGCDPQFLRTVTVDCETGAVVAVTDTTLDGQPYTVTGEPGQCQAGGGECCPEPPCPARNIVQAEKCDDTDGDGIADAWYVELLGVDCTGTPTSLGTYTCDLSAPYTPVAPVDCDAPDPVVERPAGVQAHRVQLTAGGTWNAAQYGTLRAVQATAHGGTGTVKTADGTSTLFDGETAQWSITRDMDVRLIGPLTITATTGAVVVNWTEGVDL